MTLISTGADAMDTGGASIAPAGARGASADAPAETGREHDAREQRPPDPYTPGEENNPESHMTSGAQSTTARRPRYRSSCARAPRHQFTLLIISLRSTALAPIAFNICTL